MSRTCLPFLLVAAMAFSGCDGTRCPGGTARVGDVCLQLGTDGANCGAVGVACHAGEVCSGGHCAATCGAPLSTCGAGAEAHCADTRSDPGNCGACGAACAAGQVCSAGACQVTCTSPLETCGTGAEARCIDTRNDPANCGACGTACSGGWACQAGTCAPTCAGTGGTLCGDACIDLASDPANCGACGTACSGGWACQAGTCTPTCAGAGGTLCGDACVSLASDSANCGACGAACSPGTTCRAGACAPTCPAGQARCGDRCVDLASDEANCGACGRSCPGIGVCALGACTALACRGEVGLPSVPDLVGPRAFSVAAGDVDGDGRPDLVSGEVGIYTATSTVVVQRNLGSRRFAPPVAYQASAEVSQVRLGDVGGDGRLDVVATGGGYVMVLAGMAGGGLATPARYLGGPSGNSGLAVGDLDGDGRDDVVVANYHLSVLRGQAGNGLAQPVVTWTETPWFYPTSVALADLDGDGLLDVVGGEGQGGKIGVYRGTGGGALAPPELTQVGLEVVEVATGDVDGDGHLDVAAVLIWYETVAPSYRWGVAVLRNHGDGTLEPAVLYETGFQALSLAMGDLDGDGRADLAVGNWGDVRRVDVLRNRGDGTFLPPVPYFDEGAAALVAADLDGDGRRDLTVASGPGMGVHLLWNEGDGTFAQPPLAPAPVNPTAVAVTDLDGDGKLDAAAVDSMAGTLVTWRGRGDGTFEAGAVLDLPGASALATGDVDGDGRADLLVSAQDPQTLTDGLQVLLSRAGTFVPGQLVGGISRYAQPVLADLDGDGLVDLLAAGSAVVVFPGRGDGTFGAPWTVAPADWVNDLAVGDLDGDGRLDVVAGDFDGVTAVRNLGRGEFAPPVTQLLPDLTVGGLALGDVDGDGLIDAVVAAPYDDLVSVLPGLGDGRFGAPRSTSVPFVESVAVAPLRGAGAPASVLVRSALSEAIGILEIGPGGTPGALRRWATRGGYPSGEAPMAWGDLDGDLRPDLVLGATGGIAVLRSACLP